MLLLCVGVLSVVLPQCFGVLSGACRITGPLQTVALIALVIWALSVASMDEIINASKTFGGNNTDADSDNYERTDSVRASAL